MQHLLPQDGVNDAPALKRADAGIAMGRSGSEVAKEASDLVLADDNFASIVAAVREGRTVYANIKKVISWTLPTSAGEALTIIAALLFAWTLPVTAVQILWVNLITAVTLGLALSWADLRGTPVVWAVVAVIVVAQLAVTYLPPLQRVFETRAVPLIDGLLVLGIGVALFCIIELEKRVRLAWRALRQGRR